MRIRKIVRCLIGLVLLFATAAASAQVEFHRAYRGVRPDSVPASFPNDGVFQFMSRQPFIEAKDLLSAKTGYADGAAYVEVAITNDAMKKINELAAANARAFDRDALDETVGLAFVVDGKPVQVVQGVNGPLAEPTIWWYLGNFSLSRDAALSEAEALAEIIRRSAR